MSYLFENKKIKINEIKKEIKRRDMEIESKKEKHKKKKEFLDFALIALGLSLFVLTIGLFATLFSHDDFTVLILATWGVVFIAFLLFLFSKATFGDNPRLRQITAERNSLTGFKKILLIKPKMKFEEITSLLEGLFVLNVLESSEEYLLRFAFLDFSITEKGIVKGDRKNLFIYIDKIKGVYEHRVEHINYKI